MIKYALKSEQAIWKGRQGFSRLVGAERRVRVGEKRLGLWREVDCVAARFSPNIPNLILAGPAFRRYRITVRPAPSFARVQTCDEKSIWREICEVVVYLRRNNYLLFLVDYIERCTCAYTPSQPNLLRQSQGTVACRGVNQQWVGSCNRPIASCMLKQIRWKRQKIHHHDTEIRGWIDRLALPPNQSKSQTPLPS